MNIKLLKILHAIGLTNLSNEQVRKYSLGNSNLNKEIEAPEKIELLRNRLNERIAPLEERIADLIRLTDEIKHDNKVFKKHLINIQPFIEKDISKKKKANWSEVILERILEKSNLKKEEYELAKSGSFYDYSIYLPGNKRLIIESKISLKEYEIYLNTTNDKLKEDAIVSFTASVKQHVTSLRKHSLSKDADYLLMFIPIESAFSALIQHGGDLYNEAYKSNIIIVSPSTLSSTLRTVSSIWRDEYTKRDASNITNKSKEIISEISSLLDD